MMTHVDLDIVKRYSKVIYVLGGRFVTSCPSGFIILCTQKNCLSEITLVDVS